MLYQMMYQFHQYRQIGVTGILICEYGKFAAIGYHFYFSPKPDNDNEASRY